jgi:hypothetical protein
MLFKQTLSPQPAPDNSAWMGDNFCTVSGVHAGHQLSDKLPSLLPSQSPAG